MNSSRPISVELKSVLLSRKKETSVVLSDQELISGCLKGTREYQDILYRKYSPVVYGICLRYCKNRDEAQDLMHDCLIKVFTHLDTFKSNSSLKTWISRIALYHVINFLKKRVVKDIGKDVYALDYPDGEPEGFMDDEDGEINISTEELLELIRILPEGYRTILNLFAVEKYSHREIAHALGITESTSKSQLFKARRMLKELLKKYTIKCRERIK